MKFWVILFLTSCSSLAPPPRRTWRQRTRMAAIAAPAIANVTRVAVDGMRGGALQRRRRAPVSVSDALTAINGVVFALQTMNPSITLAGRKDTWKILHGGEFYRLLTPVFLHGSLHHLLGAFWATDKTRARSRA